ncbi:MAG TPA: hypothetical protein VFK33_05815 [Bacillales bacterium]|nr:hypothetical protein [Bacillales bacterium]
MSRKIRNRIDKAIGEQRIFTEQDKKAIYSKVQKEGVHQMKFRRKNKWAIPLSYGLTAALLFVLMWAGIHKNPPEENASSVHKTSRVQKTSSGIGQTHHQSLTQGASPQQLLDEKPKLNTKGAKQYPKKFQIVKMMYYSWNHIHNIQGQIVYGYPPMTYKGEPSHFTGKTTFYLDLDHQRNWAKQLVTNKGKLDYLEKVFYQNHKIIMERPKQKVFTELHFQDDFNVYQALKFDNSNVTNSQWVRFLEDNYKNWSYKEGTKLGMPVYEIKGTTKSEAPFKMTIAKKTGIVLDFKEYDNKNPNVLDEYMTVKQIKINQGIPASQFKLNVSGDKKQSFVDYNSRIGSGGLLDRGKICGPNCE